jgi:phospholipid/cholesterol/gamma-HCH transport system substrate-binding protein
LKRERTMTRTGLEIRVGFTVVLASVILVLGVMWFQKFKLVEKRYQFFARFGEVGGLKSGDQIYVNGVERGRVRSVNLVENGVVVELGVRVGSEIPYDSHVMIKSVGIMGERFVAITKGSSPHIVAPGDTINGEFLMGLSEVMGSAGEILDELAKTSQNLRKILELLSEEGRLQTAIDDLSQASANLREITAENQPRLANAIKSIEDVSANMDSLISRHYASLDSSLAGFGRTGQEIDVAAQNFAQSSEDLKEITRRLREGEGTLGKLLSDDEFLENLQGTIAKLDSLILDIKLHPGRYVRLELF